MNQAKRYAILAAVLVLALAAGCNQPDMERSKSDTYTQWAEARADIQRKLAFDNYQHGQLKDAHKNATEALSLVKNDSPLRLLLAKVNLEMGRYEDAMVQLRTLAGDLPREGEIHYLTGVALEKQGRLAEALSSYNLAYELDNANLSAVEAAAEVLVSLGRLSEAQTHLETHMDEARNGPGTYELAGRLAMLAEQYDKAEIYFQQAADLDGNNKRYPEMVIAARYAAGKHRQVLGNLHDLIARRNGDVPSWLYVMQGDCKMALGQPAGAAPAYLAATRLDPNNPGVWAALARAALASHDVGRAIQAAGEGCRIEPDHLESATLLGFALLRAERPAEALTVLQKAAEAHPADGMLQCVLGRAYQAAGNSDRARKCFQRALQLEPNNVTAKTLLAQNVSPPKDAL
jgi:tetratricopeptide (TPR) repeat protein